MNISRRGFINSFAALAALAVIPETVLPLEKNDYERLMDMMKDGVINRHTFYLDGPITLDTDRIIITECEFIFNCPIKMERAITVVSKNIIMRSCHINCGLNGADYGLFVTDNVNFITSYKNSMGARSFADGRVVIFSIPDIHKHSEPNTIGRL